MKKIVALAVWLACLPVHAASLDEARGLLAQGKAEQAWSLLSAAEAEQGGDVEFDYLLGLAALDSGRPAEAVTALERLLAVNPAHHGARMELARAYYALGADTLAEREFQQLQGLNPPPQARGAIEQYLRAISSRQKGKGPQHRLWMEAGLGYDSNITAVTDDFSSAAAQTYGIVGLQPSAGNATPRDDLFYSLNAGWGWRSAVSRWMQDAEITASYKGYADYSAYSTLVLAGSAGVSLREGRHYLRGGISGLLAWQDTEQTSGDEAVSNDRSSLGLSGQWRFDLSQTRQTSLQLQYNQMRQADVAVNDINQIMLQASLTEMLGKQGVAVISGWYSMDDAINSLPNGQDYSRQTLGVRLLGQWQLHERVAVFGLYGLSQRRDEDSNARSSLPDKGRDTQQDVTLGLTWQWQPQWSVRLQHSYGQNRSNFDLYEYERHESSLMLRRDFR